MLNISPVSRFELNIRPRGSVSDSGSGCEYPPVQRQEERGRGGPRPAARRRVKILDGPDKCYADRMFHSLMSVTWPGTLRCCFMGPSVNNNHQRSF